MKKPVIGLLHAIFYCVLVAKKAGRSGFDTPKVIKAPWSQTPGFRWNCFLPSY